MCTDCVRQISRLPADVSKSVSIRKYLGCPLALLLITCNQVMLACGGEDKEVSEEWHKEWGRENSTAALQHFSTLELHAPTLTGGEFVSRDLT